MYRDSDVPVFIGAPVGSLGDAYSVDPTVTVEAAKAYHQEQINIFREVGVDFVNAVTLSTVAEALGIALAAEESGLPYTIGFILNEAGTLLDGTPLAEAISRVDESTLRKPLGYLITCTHASIVATLEESHADAYAGRLIGVQTNGTHLSTAVRAVSTVAVADSPEKFAEDLWSLQQTFGFKIMAGCCGTSRDYLAALAERCKCIFAP